MEKYPIFFEEVNKHKERQLIILPIFDNKLNI